MTPPPPKCPECGSTWVEICDESPDESRIWIARCLICDFYAHANNGQTWPDGWKK